MRIPSFRILKTNASERVAASENIKRVTLVYGGIVAALSVLMLLVDYVLDLQIARTGGLSNMELGTILSAVQSVLPIVQSFVVLCLELGFLAAMLRVSRRQYISENTLKLGFDRFWVLLRWTLIQSGIFMALGLAAFWISLNLYMITPLSRPVMEIIAPLAADAAITPEAILTDTALMDQLTVAMLPMFLLFGVVYLAGLIPISYSMRMVNYILIDKPAMGAMAAFLQSRRMMKGNCLRLFRLDVSLWWWYLALIGVSFAGYADVLLTAAGISLPISPEAAYFGSYALFLILQLVLTVFLRTRVEVVYAQVYDALKPREKDTGVVLGNIFQM